jgi:hypothetical protein
MSRGIRISGEGAKSDLEVECIEEIESQQSHLENSRRSTGDGNLLVFCFSVLLFLCGWNGEERDAHSTIVWRCQSAKSLFII